MNLDVCTCSHTMHVKAPYFDISYITKLRALNVYTNVDLTMYRLLTHAEALQHFRNLDVA